MREYILRRLVSMVPVLFIVSLISFALLYILPGDPALAMLGEMAAESLFVLLQGGEVVERDRTVPVSLVIRESSGG